MSNLYSQITPNLPCSVTLQPGPEDTGKVHYPSTNVFWCWFGEIYVAMQNSPLSRVTCSCFLSSKACGVDFEVKAFCAENVEEKIHKRYNLSQWHPTELQTQRKTANITLLLGIFATLLVCVFGKHWIQVSYYEISFSSS